MTAAEAGECVSGLRRLMGAVASLPMPTVAVVEGYALGGGAELALACDLRVASRGGASFAFPEARLGIIPGAGGTQRLPRLVGRSAAKELVFSGRKVGADEAAAMGLADHAVDEGRAMERALEIAAEVAQVRVWSCVCDCGVGAGLCDGGGLASWSCFLDSPLSLPHTNTPFHVSPPLPPSPPPTLMRLRAPPWRCVWPRRRSTGGWRSACPAVWRWRSCATRGCCPPGTASRGCGRSRRSGRLVTQVNNK